MYRKKENEIFDVDLFRVGSVYVFLFFMYGWLYEYEYDFRVFVYEVEL